VLFDQVMAEPAESKSGMVVAEARSGDHAKPNVGEARAVTVAAVEAEIDRPTDDQGKTGFASVCRLGGPSLVRTSSVARDDGFAHRRQLDQILDRAAPELVTRSARIRALPTSSVGCGDQSIARFRR